VCLCLRQRREGGTRTRVLACCPQDSQSRRAVSGRVHRTHTHTPKRADIHSTSLDRRTQLLPLTYLNAKHGTTRKLQKYVNSRQLVNVNVRQQPSHIKHTHTHTRLADCQSVDSQSTTCILCTPVVTQHVICHNLLFLVHQIYIYININSSWVYADVESCRWRNSGSDKG